MRKLTTAEEEVMHIVWRLKEAVVRDVLDQMPEPKPAYNTVSTIIKILEKKGFVTHKAYSNTYVYSPLVQKDEYAKTHFSTFLSNYFNGSFPKLASFFAKENDLSISDLEDILREAKLDIATDNKTDKTE